MGVTKHGNEAMIRRTVTDVTIAWGEGSFYDFDNPNPEVISIEDVAWALAGTERWRVQTRGPDGRRAFYGVAQHCVVGAQEMLNEGHDVEHALGFMVHEPDEIVLPNLPGPCKDAIAGWREFANLHGDAISARFGWVIPDKVLCKAWDLRMLVTEKRDLLLGFDRDQFQTSLLDPICEEAYAPFIDTIRPWSVEEAAERWLSMYRVLGGPE